MRDTVVYDYLVSLGSYLRNVFCPQIAWSEVFRFQVWYYKDTKNFLAHPLLLSWILIELHRSTDEHGRFRQLRYGMASDLSIHKGTLPLSCSKLLSDSHWYGTWRSLELFTIHSVLKGIGQDHLVNKHLISTPVRTMEVSFWRKIFVRSKLLINNKEENMDLDPLLLPWTELHDSQGRIMSSNIAINSFNYNYKISPYVVNSLTTRLCPLDDEFLD